MFVADARTLGSVATRWGGTTPGGFGTHKANVHVYIHVSLARGISSAMLAFIIQRPLRPEPKIFVGDLESLVKAPLDKVQ